MCTPFQAGAHYIDVGGGYYIRVGRNHGGETESAGNAGCAHVQLERRNVDVDARAQVAPSNAASGANDERAQDRTSEPPGGGTTPARRSRTREGGSLRKKYRKSVWEFRGLTFCAAGYLFATPDREVRSLELLPEILGLKAVQVR